jgi:hypothetical protein
MAGKPLDGWCSRIVKQQRLYSGVALVALLRSDRAGRLCRIARAMQQRTG